MYQFEVYTRGYIKFKCGDKKFSNYLIVIDPCLSPGGLYVCTISVYIFDSHEQEIE